MKVTCEVSIQININWRRPPDLLVCQAYVKNLLALYIISAQVSTSKRYQENEMSGEKGHGWTDLDKGS